MAERRCAAASERRLALARLRAVSAPASTICRLVDGGEDAASVALLRYDAGASVPWHLASGAGDRPRSGRLAERRSADATRPARRHQRGRHGAFGLVGRRLRGPDPVGAAGQDRRKTMRGGKRNGRMHELESLPFTIDASARRLSQRGCRRKRSLERGRAAPCARPAIPASSSRIAPLADAEGARRRRSAPSIPSAKPLWGVPVAVKDNIDVPACRPPPACPDYAYPPDARRRGGGAAAAAPAR